MVFRSSVGKTLNFVSSLTVIWKESLSFSLSRTIVADSAMRLGLGAEGSGTGLFDMLCCVLVSDEDRAQSMCTCLDKICLWGLCRVGVER